LFPAGRFSGRGFRRGSDRLRQEGRLARDRDGRYYLGSSPPGVTGIVGSLYPDPNEGT
jgi:hypothetical protein